MYQILKNSIVLILLSSSILATSKLYNFEQPKQFIKMTIGKSKDALGENITKSCYLYNKYIVIEINDPAIMVRLASSTIYSVLFVYKIG